MKIKKILAGVAAGAMAVSSLATAAFAEGEKYPLKGTESTEDFSVQSAKIVSDNGKFAGRETKMWSTGKKDAVLKLTTVTGNNRKTTSNWDYIVPAANFTGTPEDDDNHTWKTGAKTLADLKKEVLSQGNPNNVDFKDDSFAEITDLGKYDSASWVFVKTEKDTVDPYLSDKITVEKDQISLFEISIDGYWNGDIPLWLGGGAITKDSGIGWPSPLTVTLKYTGTDGKEKTKTLDPAYEPKVVFSVTDKDSKAAYKEKAMISDIDFEKDIYVSATVEGVVENCKELIDQFIGAPHYAVFKMRQIDSDFETLNDVGIIPGMNSKDAIAYVYEYKPTSITTVEGPWRLSITDAQAKNLEKGFYVKADIQHPLVNIKDESELTETITATLMVSQNGRNIKNYITKVNPEDKEVVWEIPAADIASQINTANLANLVFSVVKTNNDNTGIYDKNQAIEYKFVNAYVEAHDLTGKPDDGNNPSDSQPADSSKPADSQPADSSKPADSQPADSSKPADTNKPGTDDKNMPTGVAIAVIPAALAAAGVVISKKRK